MGRVNKRRPADALTSAQMLQVLSEMRLVSLLHDNHVMLAVDALTAKHLDRCCTGQKDCGPGSAKEISDVLQQWEAHRSSSQVRLFRHLQHAWTHPDHACMGAQGASQGPHESLMSTSTTRQSESNDPDCCNSIVEGGTVLSGDPQTAPNPSACSPALIAVRLSLEEAFFLKYVLDSLTVILRPSAPGEEIRALDEKVCFLAFQGLALRAPLWSAVLRVRIWSLRT